jgi:hypothetical protein
MRDKLWSSGSCEGVSEHHERVEPYDVLGAKLDIVRRFYVSSMQCGL